VLFDNIAHQRNDSIDQEEDEALTALVEALWQLSDKHEDATILHRIFEQWHAEDVAKRQEDLSPAQRRAQDAIDRYDMEED
jgi:hypothetical protein